MSELGGMCRFYDKEFPDVEETVIVNVKRIAEMGAYVQLLEYNNLEGMILLSELSRRRIRSINKLLRVGKNEVVMVIRVDKEKKYIDLSKRRVSADDIRRADERFNKSKSVHGVLRHVSMHLRVPMLSLYQRVVWPLSRKYGHALDAFQLSVSDPEAIFGPLEGVSEDERREFLDFIKVRMTPQPLKIRADIKCFCFAYEGVEAVREALLAAQALSSKDVPIKVQLISPPLYVMLSSTVNKELGIATMNAAIEEAKRVLTAKGGDVSVEMAPSVTTASDDSQLDRMLEQLKAEEEEGDEEEEEEEGEGREGKRMGGGGGGGGGEAEDEGLGSADFETPGTNDFATVRVPISFSGGGSSSSSSSSAAAEAGPAMTAMEKLKAMLAANSSSSSSGSSSSASASASASAGGSSSKSAAVESSYEPVSSAALAAAGGGGPEGEAGAATSVVFTDQGHVFNAHDTELMNAQTTAALAGKKKKAKKVTVVEDD